MARAVMDVLIFALREGLHNRNIIATFPFLSQK